MTMTLFATLALGITLGVVLGLLLGTSIESGEHERNRAALTEARAIIAGLWHLARSATVSPWVVDSFGPSEHGYDIIVDDDAYVAEHNHVAPTTYVTEGDDGGGAFRNRADAALCAEFRNKLPALADALALRPSVDGTPSDENLMRDVEMCAVSQADNDRLRCVLPLGHDCKHHFVALDISRNDPRPGKWTRNDAGELQFEPSDDFAVPDLSKNPFLDESYADKLQREIQRADANMEAQRAEARQTNNWYCGECGKHINFHLPTCSKLPK